MSIDRKHSPPAHERLRAEDHGAHECGQAARERVPKIAGACTAAATLASTTATVASERQSQRARRLHSPAAAAKLGGRRTKRVAPARVLPRRMAGSPDVPLNAAAARVVDPRDPVGPLGEPASPHRSWLRVARVRVRATTVAADAGGVRGGVVPSSSESAKSAKGS